MVVVEMSISFVFNLKRSSRCLESMSANVFVEPEICFPSKKILFSMQVKANFFTIGLIYGFEV